MDSRRLLIASLLAFTGGFPEVKIPCPKGDPQSESSKREYLDAAEARRKRRAEKRRSHD
jgi:hypothetical protein